MAKHQYPRRTSGTFIVKCQAPQLIIVRPCLPSRYAAKVTMQGTEDGIVVAEEDRVNHGGTTSRNGQASHCRRCCASQITEVDGRSLQRRCLSSTERGFAITGVSPYVTTADDY